MDTGSRADRGDSFFGTGQMGKCHAAIFGTLKGLDKFPGLLVLFLYVYLTVWDELLWFLFWVKRFGEFGVFLLISAFVRRDHNLLFEIWIFIPCLIHLLFLLQGRATLSFVLSSLRPWWLIYHDTPENATQRSNLRLYDPQFLIFQFSLPGNPNTSY